MTLVKTADLDASKNYLFGVHPHGNPFFFNSIHFNQIKQSSISKGLLPIGSLINLGTDATGFRSLFPNITPHVLTVGLFFNLALIREILLFMGCGTVSKESIEYILENKGKCSRPGQV
jgi:hypothetical protein